MLPQGWKLVNDICWLDECICNPIIGRRISYIGCNLWLVGHPEPNRLRVFAVRQNLT